MSATCVMNLTTAGICYPAVRQHQGAACGYRSGSSAPLSLSTSFIPTNRLAPSESKFSTRLQPFSRPGNVACSSSSTPPSSFSSPLLLDHHLLYPNTTASAAFPRIEDMDPSTILMDQRIVFLGTQVDDMSADLLISQLLVLDARDPTEDIKLIINSPGGSVTAGMGIYDAMKLCRADISTICFGLAASMGAFLLAAGTKGKRYCMPNSRVMIHQPLGGIQGSATEVGLQMKEMLYHKVKLNKLLSRFTGKSEEQVELDTDRDNFMSPWEAMEYGLVDGIIGADDPDLVAPVGEVKEPVRTKVWDLWTSKEGQSRRVLPGEDQLTKKP